MSFLYVDTFTQAQGNHYNKLQFLVTGKFLFAYGKIFVSLSEKLKKWRVRDWEQRLRNAVLIRPELGALKPESNYDP